jgi:hypothetical protein
MTETRYHFADIITAPGLILTTSLENDSGASTG